MHHSFIIGETPDKVSLDSINKVEDFLRDGDILHDVVMDITKRSFG